MGVIRHGDLVLFRIDTLPKGLEQADTNVIMIGSNNNNHSVVNGELYFKEVDQFVFGYLVAGDETYLTHVDHGSEDLGGGLKKAVVPNGIYELRRQVEVTHDGMKVVVD